MKKQLEQYLPIVEVYNTEGRQAAASYIREKTDYKNCYALINRMKLNRELMYDPDKDIFRIGVSASCDAVPEEDSDAFMTLDELIGRADSAIHIPPAKPMSTHHDDLHELALNLLKERFLLLNRYVSINPIDNEICVNQDLAHADGYRVKLKY